MSDKAHSLVQTTDEVQRANERERCAGRGPQTSAPQTMAPAKRGASQAGQRTACYDSTSPPEPDRVIGMKVIGMKMKVAWRKVNRRVIRLLQNMFACAVGGLSAKRQTHAVAQCRPETLVVQERWSRGHFRKEGWLPAYYYGKLGLLFHPANRGGVGVPSTHIHENCADITVQK